MPDPLWAASVACILLASLLLCVRYTVLRDDASTWRRDVSYAAYVFFLVAAVCVVWSFAREGAYRRRIRTLNADPHYREMSDEMLVHDGYARTPDGKIYPLKDLAAAQRTFLQDAL